MRLRYSDEEIILSRILANSNEKKRKKIISIRFDIDIDRYCLLFPQRIIRPSFE